MAPRSRITSIDDAIEKEKLRGQPVLVRIDAEDEMKLGEAAPTLAFLSQCGARIIIATHSRIKNLSAKLTDLLGRPISKFSAVAQLREGDIALMKDLALEPGEEVDDEGLADELSHLGDIYCNEAFALSHELRASTVGVAKKVPLAVAGKAFDRDLRALETVLHEPRQFVLVLLGGVLSKESLLLAEQIAKRSDRVLIAGQLCFPFLMARGFVFHGPAVTDELVSIAARMMADAADKKRFVLTPFDFTVMDKSNFEKLAHGKRFVPSPPALNVQENQLQPEHVICDIGPVTQWNWTDYFGAAGKVFWHGPLGITEIKLFRAGTKFLAEQLAIRFSETVNRTVICGGSMVEALRSIRFPKEKLHHLTPAGRTALHLFAGSSLPAVEALSASRRPKPKPRRILIPLDGSERDLDALDAVVWTLPRDAHVFLLHVWPGIDEEQYPDTLAALSDADKLARRLESERIFARANTVLAQSGLTSLHQVVAQGKPAEVISRYARRMEAELIVLSSQRQSHAKHHIVEHTARAALLARPRAGGRHLWIG